MNRRNAAVFIFVLMIIGAVWWMKSQVDLFVGKFEQKVKADRLSTAALQERKPLVTLPHEPDHLKPVATPTGMTGEAAELMREMLVRFNVGDYRVALSMADQAAQNNRLGPQFMEWLQRQMPALLTSAGWLEIKMGNCAEAIAILQRAYLVTKEPPVTKGLAYCHYRMQNWASTEEFAKQFLTAMPRDEDVLTLYADALESEQRFNDAAELLARLAELKPEDEAIQKSLTSMRAKAKESVRQINLTSRYVNLTYRAGEHEEFADFVTNSLDRAAEEFIDQYGFIEPINPVEVILYAGDNFQSLVSNGPDWAAGIFDGRMRIPIREEYRSDRGKQVLLRILRHELVHALLALQVNFRNLPSWFNEGLAQRLECSDRCRDSLFPPNPGDFLSQEDLNMPYTSYQKLKAERSYRQSLYLIYTIEHQTEYGAGDNLERIVAGIGKNTDISSDGLLRPLGWDYARLHQSAAQAWRHHTDY